MRVFSEDKKRRDAIPLDTVGGFVYLRGGAGRPTQSLLYILRVPTWGIRLAVAFRIFCSGGATVTNVHPPQPSQRQPSPKMSLTSTESGASAKCSSQEASGSPE